MAWFCMYVDMSASFRFQILALPDLLLICIVQCFKKQYKGRLVMTELSCLIDCSTQQSKPEEVIYADIERPSQPPTENSELYANVTPTNDYQAVIYSDLLQKDDTADHTVQPSSDLYAE